ncbi:MAG: UDP-N-acetylmuramate--L-alanine ligase [Candidatus Omnitrophica bacterium 4484_70.1]|nr:MAG: UDP-N-acetylmuramate--L-alanine ligase [Candidatus Omnitrophica bacterium 4484_70.1]
MEKILSKLKKVHLIGIGGIGMAGLAYLLKEKGFLVSGSDIRENNIVKQLCKEGVTISLGHRKENLEGAEIVSYSSAIKKSNPELKEAKRRGLVVLKRAELLSLLSQKEKTIAVTGSHGKTTTSSLLSFVLTTLGYSPAVFIGGVSLNYDKLAWWGKELFVIEADESDASFLYYTPWVSLITNIDFEHLDYYKSIENLRDHFLKFASKTTGITIGCGDDENTAYVLNRVPSITYGFSPGNEVRAERMHFDKEFSCFDLIIAGKRIGRVSIPLLGEHNVLNTLAVLSFFYYLKEDMGRVIPALRGFKGTKRRFEKRVVEGVTFIEDYAHHHTEIKAVLKAAQPLRGKRKIIIFQPHRFSRIKLLYSHFRNCFFSCDYLIITDIYPAGEKKINGVDGLFLYNEIKKSFSGRIEYVPKRDLVEVVPPFLREGDLVFFLGAGDINLVMNEIIRRFTKIHSKAGSFS